MYRSKYLGHVNPAEEFVINTIMEELRVKWFM